MSKESGYLSDDEAEAIERALREHFERMIALNPESEMLEHITLTIGFQEPPAGP